MVAVFVNCATILAGCLVGLFFAKKIPQKVTDAIQIACGLVSFVMGVQMSFKYQNVVYLAIALILGGIVGTVLDIDGKILAFGKFLERVFVRGVAGDSPAEGVAENAADSVVERSRDQRIQSGWSEGETSPTLLLQSLYRQILICVNTDTAGNIQRSLRNLLSAQI